MRRLLPTLMAALFSMATFAAYAADDPAEQKQAKKQAPVVEQGAPAAEGRGDPTGAPAAGGGVVEQGTPAAEGRGTPEGTAAGGAVTSPTPKGPGRDSQ